MLVNWELCLSSELYLGFQFLENDEISWMMLDQKFEVLLFSFTFPVFRPWFWYSVSLECHNLFIWGFFWQLMRLQPDCVGWDGFKSDPEIDEFNQWRRTLNNACGVDVLEKEGSTSPSSAQRWRWGRMAGLAWHVGVVLSRQFDNCVYKLCGRLWVNYFMDVVKCPKL